MMKTDETKLIPREIMMVFNTIYTNGKSQDGGKFYQGLQATSSFDGYTLMISNIETTVYLYFHNKLKLDSPNARSKEDFYTKYRLILAEQ
tara:strand:+ start:851 stop:1120 length:270 start_codon:yes stop_codon:yes gene_type:complete